MSSSSRLGEEEGEEEKDENTDEEEEDHQLAKTDMAPIV